MQCNRCFKMTLQSSYYVLHPKWEKEIPYAGEGCSTTKRYGLVQSGSKELFNHLIHVLYMFFANGSIASRNTLLSCLEGGSNTIFWKLHCF